MSARQFVVPPNLRPRTRPWRRVFLGKGIQAIDACRGLILLAIVQVQPRLLCYRPCREPSPVPRDPLILSALQYSAGTLEIPPGSGDPCDHEIAAPHAVQHSPGRDQRSAIDDPGFRLI